MAKKILVVDDSTSIRTAAAFTLEAAGYEVVQAADGKEALEALKGIQKQDLGMVITDINMPNMDGITLIKEIKQTDYKFAPILVLTTESQESKKKEGQQAGAAGWLVKPFQAEQLVGVVKKFLS